MKVLKLLSLPLMSLCCLASCGGGGGEDPEGGVTPFRNPRHTIRVVAFDGTGGVNPYIQIRDIQYEEHYNENDLKLWFRKLNYHYHHEEGRFPYIEVDATNGKAFGWDGKYHEYIFPHYIKSLKIVIYDCNGKRPAVPTTQPGSDSSDPEVIEKGKKGYGYYYYTSHDGSQPIGLLRQEKQEPYMYNFRISTITVLYSLEGEQGDIMDLDTYYWNSYYKVPESPINPEGYTFQYYSSDLEGKDRIEDKKATFDHDTTIYAYCTKNK